MSVLQNAKCPDKTGPVLRVVSNGEPGAGSNPATLNPYETHDKGVDSAGSQRVAGGGAARHVWHSVVVATPVLRVSTADADTTSVDQLRRRVLPEPLPL